MSARAPAKTSASAPIDRLVYDTAELGQLLRLSARTVRRHAAAGKIPRAVRIGGSKRFRAAEIHNWIDAGCPCRAEWERMQSTRDTRRPATRRPAATVRRPSSTSPKVTNKHRTLLTTTSFVQ
jgi:excisionase family DNA binding protein